MSEDVGDLFYIVSWYLLDIEATLNA